MSVKKGRNVLVDLGEVFVEAQFQGEANLPKVNLATRKDLMLPHLKEALSLLLSEQPPITEDDSITIRSDYFQALWRERWLPPMALVATEGFQNLLELGNQTRSGAFTFLPSKPAPFIPMDHCFGLTERINAKGEGLMSPSEEEILALIEKLKMQDIKYVAVCFLHSHLNSENEIKTAKIFEANGFVTQISSQFQGSEYKRATDSLKQLAEKNAWEGILGETRSFGFTDSQVNPYQSEDGAELLFLPDRFLWTKSGETLPFSLLSPLFVDHTGAPQIRYLGPLNSAEQGPVCFGKSVNLTVLDLLALKYDLQFQDVRKLKVDHARTKKQLTLLAQQLRTDQESTINYFLTLSRELFETEIHPFKVTELNVKGSLAPYFLGRIKI